jgi:Fe-S cluster assembly ATP-binding protein
MLKISKLSVSIDETKILKNISTEYQPGTLNIIMGSNGSGKSSFLYSLMGHPTYEVSSGDLFYKESLQEISPDKRARLGLFLAMQEPIELPGVSVLSFLHACYKTYQEDISMTELVAKVKELALFVGLSELIVERNVHEGFSGGEKKRFELLQMLLFLPEVVLLDEIDSGLDIQGFKLVVRVLEKYREQKPNGIVVMVTHHIQMLEQLPVDTITVLAQGSIVQSGGKKVAQEIIMTKQYETK